MTHAIAKPYSHIGEVTIDKQLQKTPCDLHITLDHNGSCVPL